MPFYLQLTIMRLSILFQAQAEIDRKANIKITKQLQKEFEDVFNSIGCFDGMFSLQVKPESKPYQVPHRHIGYALRNCLKRNQKDFSNKTSVACITSTQNVYN